MELWAGFNDWLLTEQNRIEKFCEFWDKAISISPRIPKSDSG